MDQPQGRLFEQILEKVPRSDITARLEREARMDPDYWMVEVDSDAGKIDLPLAEEEAAKAPDPFFKF